ncbi:anthranilate phosphoribosyltransferase [Mariprofundus sp. NF]|uniref:anthranilate phosphoribosyltransferase n=1 Tax=Mariprofundus sp. NF TaxID=2608716 RepID=UPI0015A240F8|nr:anthranilate phosphoribosyltransferase [Mariprofundus sp. NF]NWF38830.1 anthranilate phosphoribosyltransferase [Mariprofundus sp. NF]
MDISPLISRVARGKNGSQNLTQQEATLVFDQLLAVDADELQLGAFLIAQRMKGECSDELAGFVEAARLHMDGFGTTVAPAGAVDLPCYAGKRRAGHAYLVAALQARDAGIPVFVHGVEAIDGRITAWQVLRDAGVQRAGSLVEAADLLAADGIVYTDLAELCPDLMRIYGLRPRLGVRSFANSVARLLNPLRCAGQLNGFFHTPYADYMAGANTLLGQNRSLIFMGAEGEPELYADRQKVVVKQQGDQISRISFAEAGLLPYPKEVMDLNLLHKESITMLHKPLEGREAVVVARMLEAMNWASSGEFPDGWREEE